MSKTIAIDEEGFFILQNGLRMDDTPLGQKWLESLVVDNFGVSSFTHNGETIICEPFDKPFVAKQVHLENSQLFIQLPYQSHHPVILDSLCIDQWDRFHGMTTNNIPFVLSRAAQAELFNLADAFSDDSITIGGQQIQTPEYYIFADQINDEPFWTEKYIENPLPNWDLGQAHPELKTTLPQLKINKIRILIPGCGNGHDAAFLAEQGHIVTAVDLSPKAIAAAKQAYGHIDNLQFIEGDALDLSEKFHNSFDLIFEHTFYCAITPNRRDQLIKQWKRYLAETGHVLGIFFVVPKRGGPYFGGSEWELREKLSPHFNFLYWTRLKHSPGWRKGAELIVYAQIKSS